MRIEEERFYPNGFMPPWVRYQHLERYRWAAKFVAGKRVLDVACGTGYGTALLANAGAAQALAVKFHQARKCLGWPWESPHRHLPTPCSGEPAVTEVLIAACLSEAPSWNTAS